MGSSVQPSSIDGVLDIALHHATDIHNICIYGNQDVYTKFSISDTQDAVYSTEPVRGGGKNPVFNQSLKILVPKMDAMLKCEIWMMSCVRMYLQDQLLGFVLIPLCDIFGRGRVTKGYSLSSTELFHTPAGIVCLSLTFYVRGTDVPLYAVCSDSEQNSVHDVCGNGIHEVKGDDMHERITESTHDMVMSTPMEYSNIEFPDLQDACENQEMVSVYLNMASGVDASTDENARGKEDWHDGVRMHVNEQDCSGASFLQLGSSPMTEDDSEMGTPNGEVKPNNGACSPSHSSILQEDMIVISSRDSPSVSKPKEVQFFDSASTLSIENSPHSTQKSVNLQSTSSPTSTILAGGLSSPVAKMGSSTNGHEMPSSFTAPLVTISLEPDEPVVQQQIVDMYMKSMQQFTESLAKMKLPLDDAENAHTQVELNNEARVEKEGPTAESTNKDGHKVFYGSRAFF